MQSSRTENTKRHSECKICVSHSRRSAGGIKLTDRRDQPLKLSAKINKIRSCSAFTSKFVRQRLTLELLDDLDKWRVRRNKLVHYLMNSPTASEELQAAAKEGYELVKQLDNKVKSVNQYFDKKIGN